MLNNLLDHNQKEIIQMELNKLSYWEDILKLRVNIEKSKVLQIGSKNIKVGYKLNKKKIRKVNEEYVLGVGFDDTFKADNRILSTYQEWMEWLAGWLEILFQRRQMLF